MRREIVSELRCLGTDGYGAIPGTRQSLVKHRSWRNSIRPVRKEKLRRLGLGMARPENTRYDES